MDAVQSFNSFADIVTALMSPFLIWLLSFFPSGEPSIFEVIDSIGMVGGELTFNVFYFIDLASVFMCLGVLITVMLIVMILKLVNRSVDLASKAVEAIPVIE